VDRLHLEASSECTLKEIGRLRRLLSTACLGAGVPNPAEHRLITCFSEIATNIVTHTDPKAENVSLRFGQSLSDWWIKITDDGGRPDDAESGLHDPETESEHGRGLFIVQSMADSFRIETSHRGKTTTTIGVARETSERQPSVLLVEDDPALRRLYSTYLDDDYDVTTAPDGERALKSLSAQTFDVIISDIRMPIKDGFELRQALLDDEDHELTPFVFLTGATDPDVLSNAHRMVIDDCLSKPCSRVDLLHSVDRAIRRTRQLRQRLNSRIQRQLSDGHLCSVRPSCNHWRVATEVRSPLAGGGDFIIDHSFDDARTIILVDVMGHDAAAKFFAFSYAGFLRGFLASTRHAPPPADAAQALSAVIHSNALSERSMATCCVLNLYPEGRVDYCTAGHPPLLHISASQTQALSTDGMLPGLIEQPGYQSASVTLKPGERLAVFSDGLMENSETAEGRSELENMVVSAMESALEVALDDAPGLTMSRFDEFSSTPVSDDATLLFLEPSTCTNSEHADA
jgi:sigma-B regulation protein RsbU (phosphoserine phosphatase)